MFGYSDCFTSWATKLDFGEPAFLPGALLMTAACYSSKSAGTQF